MLAASTLPHQADQSRQPRAAKALRRLLRPKPVFAMHNIHSPQRSALETYIAREFENAYGATVTQFLPQLFSMQCQGRISAVVGTRAASSGDLFVERYLDEPIERAISRVFPATVARRDVVEIGNLVATHPGACQLLFVLHAATFDKAGFRWAAFAATEQVRAIMHKLNVVTFTVGSADPKRLRDESAQWGRYYDSNPTVQVVDGAATMAQLRRSPLSATALAFFSDTIAELARSAGTGTVQ